jgi:hypothetical protein
MNLIDELNLLVTNVTIFFDNKATIGIPNNYSIGDRSTYLDIAYRLVHENVECRWICLLQTESRTYLAEICIAGVPLVT